ncbi:hypothetical protein CC117_18380 [Parafrankia colletiae]|uniref:Protein kinase domain-containing protein n=1 Tax=Parafrankia colletiae TaxID=573497 RepID=A0A1S1QNC9_9ACTN|nr:hypothetical protein CC117_18380 [Parafrankia colletiae]
MTGSIAAPLGPHDPRAIGPYQVVGLLGRGGMGSVYLAQAPGEAPDHPWVAVKVIRPELAQRPEFRARFRREADSARQVRRFATAAVLDAGTTGPSPYLVTEYVEGPTLARHVAARGPLGHADLEHLALSVATALSAIHAAGIIHRDLTPANVLLSAVGPKVIDFGLARSQVATTEISQQIGERAGTPGYMPPEQILDAPVTSAADIFAWGSIVIFAGTGRPPFGSGPTDAVLYRVVHEPPLLDGLPDELRGLVEKAVSRDPAARPTAEELRERLTGTAARTDPTATQPGTAAGPARRPSRRPRHAAKRSPATAAGAAGAATAVGTAGDQTGLVTTPAPAVPSRSRGDRRTPLLIAAAVATAVFATAVGTTLVITSGLGGAPAQTSAQDPAILSRELAARSDLARAGDAVRAGRLALAAYQISPTPQAGAAMIASFTARTALTARETTPGSVDVALSASGEQLAEAGADGRVRLWDLRPWLSPPTGASAVPHPSTLTAPVLTAPADLPAAGATSVAIRPDGTWIAWGDADGQGHLAPAGGGTSAPLTGHISPIDRIAYGGGNLLVTVAQDGSVGLWDVSQPARPSLLARLTDHSAPVTDAALSPDGSLLAVSRIDQKVQVWSLADRRRPVVLAELTGHRGAVDAVAFGGDGRTLASVSGDDGTLRRWDLTEPAHPRPLDERKVTSGALRDVAVGIHGSTATSAGDGSVVVWSAPGPAGVAELTRLPVGRGGAAADRRLAADRAGTTFAVAGAAGGPTVFTVDPRRLTRLACADGLGPDELWWSRELPDIPFDNPCRS